MEPRSWPGPRQRLTPSAASRVPCAWKCSRSRCRCPADTCKWRAADAGARRPVGPLEPRRPSVRATAGRSSGTAGAGLAPDKREVSGGPALAADPGRAARQGAPPSGFNLTKPPWPEARCHLSRPCRPVQELSEGGLGFS